MPWTPEMAAKYTKKASTAKLQKIWSDAANSARDRFLKQGMSESMASAAAIKEANSVISKLSGRI